ncbi:MAG: hypothetical protein RR244_03555 [Oscillospiraceae bacterium]
MMIYEVAVACLVCRLAMAVSEVSFSAAVIAAVVIVALGTSR